MLSITSSQECSIVQLMIPIVELLASVSKIRNTEIGKELKLLQPRTNVTMQDKTTEESGEATWYA